MGLVISSEPAAALVSTADMKAHLRVDFSDDDDLIDSLVTVATKIAEAITGRAFISQTWKLYADDFGSSDTIKIPKPPLQSITSIEYYDTAGSLQTWSSSEYEVDTISERGRVKVADGYSFPSLDNRINATIITFVAGYGDASTDVPTPIIEAVKQIVNHLYENRSPVATSFGAPAFAINVPKTADWLLTPYRVIRFK